VIKTEVCFLRILDYTLKIRAHWEHGLVVCIKPAISDISGDRTSSPLARKFMGILQGGLNGSSIPFKAAGTAFQKRVWDVTCGIPSGGLKTYGEIASEVDCRSPRAVGQALKANPLPIIIPCHRVIGKQGDLVGFSCGLEVKALLLQFEANAKFSSEYTS
jgi:methylated-DNA-[protein]-cysteine S-methyltransferase